LNSKLINLPKISNIFKSLIYQRDFNKRLTNLR
jgi:hypothetical protein